MKYVHIFSVMLLLHANTPMYSQSHWQYYKQTLSQLQDKYLYKLYPTYILGDQDPSIELKKEILEVFHCIGLRDIESICIKCLSQQALKRYGEKNACIFHLPGFTRYVFIAEEWFKTLPPHIRQFIIAHEGIHLKSHHVEKSIGIFIISLVCLRHITDTIQKKLITQFQPNRYYSYALSYGFLAIEMSILHMMSKKVSRMHEFEADRKAALALNSIEGGVALFELFQKWEQSHEAQLAQKPLIIRTLLRLIDTHPTDKQRKEALLNLVCT